MTKNARQSDPPSLGVTLAGVRFRSPIGLGPIGGGSHFGKPEADSEREGEASLRFLLEHVRAGSSCLYLNISYLTEATLGKLLEGTDPTDPPRSTPAWGERFLRAAYPGSALRRGRSLFNGFSRAEHSEHRDGRSRRSCRRGS